MGSDVLLVILAVLHKVELWEEVLLEAVEVNPWSLKQIIFPEVGLDIFLTEGHSHLDDP